MHTASVQTRRGSLSLRSRCKAAWRLEVTFNPLVESRKEYYSEMSRPMYMIEPCILCLGLRTGLCSLKMDQQFPRELGKRLVDREELHAENSVSMYRVTLD